MARHVRDHHLETRTERLKLKIGERYRRPIGDGVTIVYRRPKHGSGTWSFAQADGQGGQNTGPLGTADDYAEPDGINVLTWTQAYDKARSIGRAGPGGHADAGKLLTVAGSVEAYGRDLEVRSAEIGNATRVQHALKDHPGLACKVLALCTVRDFAAWREAMLQTMTASSVNRTAKAAKAAFALSARRDQRITNASAWEIGLAGIRDAGRSRNDVLVLDVDTIRDLAARAEAIGEGFGLWFAVASQTGARASQIRRLVVANLQDDRADPRLMMPSSRKGNGRKTITSRPVPISSSLAARLRIAAAGRPPGAPLITKADGEAYSKWQHIRNWQALGLEPGITSYALRHSSITRGLLANVPIRVVATNHDTSVGQIESTYSRYISDHSDSVARGALLDLDAPAAPAANVVPMRK